MVSHVREEALEVVSLGRGVLDRDGDTVDSGADGPDEADALPRRRRDALEEVGGGGLAVGAGHAEAAQGAGGGAVEAGRGGSEGLADVGNPGFGDTEVELAFD